MLALLTGIPGYGKTAHAIDWVFFQEDDFHGLERYVEGVSQLDNVKCPHYPFPELREVKAPEFVPLSTVDDDEDEDADKYKPWLPSHPDHQEFLLARAAAKHPLELWYLWAQKGSVVVVDEAQRFYRPRPSGSKVPLHISMLEYHRHFGIHVLLISQAPRLMDLHVRSLVEKHVHLDKTWKGGVKYEWPGARDVSDGVNRAQKIEAAKTPYSPPKHVFPYYKSSSLHLKVKHKIPRIVFLVGGAFLLFVLAAAGAVYEIKAHNFSGEKKPSPDPAHVSGKIETKDSLPVDKVAKAQKFLDDFAPVVPNRPETAPAYDSLRKVAVMPRVVACIQSSSRCRCYSQQGSYIPEVSPERCAQILENGQAFDPYQRDDLPAAAGNSSEHVVNQTASPVPASRLNGV